MDIKEIALKVGLQAFEEHPYDKGHVVSPSGYTWIDDKLIEFAEARIAELEEENARLRREDFSHERIQNDSLKLQNKVLYEQLISAQAEIKRLEERRCEICGYAEHHREHTGCLRTQLVAAQEENGRLENQVLARDAELWGRTQEILGLKEQLAAEQLNNKLLRDGVTAVNDLINDSSGVAGLHLNGDIATWEELRTGGRFEEWLCLFDEALSTIKESENKGV